MEIIAQTIKGYILCGGSLNWKGFLFFMVNTCVVLPKSERLSYSVYTTQLNHCPKGIRTGISYSISLKDRLCGINRRYFVQGISSVENMLFVC